MIDNLIAFIPLGLLLSLNFKRTGFWRKLTFVFMLSLAVEAMQYVLAIGVSDITDVIMNTVGELAGPLLKIAYLLSVMT
jgi:glycopeptide antibiotics resistance protein